LRRLYPPSHCAPARRALGSHGCPSQVANQLTGQPARSQARLSSPTSPYCGPRLRRGAHSCRILREGGHQDEAMVSLRPPRGRQSTSTGTQPPWIPGATDSLRSARSPMRSERRTTPGDRQRRPWRSSRSLPVLHIASRGVWIRRFRVVADRHDRGPSISSDLTSVGALDRARHRFPVLVQSLWDTTSVLPLWRSDLGPTRGPGSRRGATCPASYSAPV